MLSSPLIFVACIVALFAMRGKPLERYLFSIGFILAAIWMLLPWGFYVAYPVQTHENYIIIRRGTRLSFAYRSSHLMDLCSTGFGLVG